MPSALVTGGSSGIGFAIARMLCTEGYDVTVASRTREKIEAAAAELGAHAVTANMGSEEDCVRCVEERIRNRACRGGERDLSCALRELILPVDDDGGHLRGVLEPKDRVCDPVAARDVLGVELGLLLEDAARSHDHASHDLVLEEAWVDRQPLVLDGVDVFHDDLACLFVDLDVGHGAGDGVLVCDQGDAATVHDIRAGEA